MQLLNIHQLSMVLNVKQKTIYGWVHLKKIPYYKLEGSLRFNEDEILKWIKSKRITTHKTEDNA